MEAIQQYVPLIWAWMTKMTYGKFPMGVTWQMSLHLHLLYESWLGLCVEADWNIEADAPVILHPLYEQAFASDKSIILNLLLQ